MVVPQNRWFEMVSLMENPMNKWMIWRYPHDSGNPMNPPYHQKSASESSHVIYAEIRRCQCSLFPRCGREEIRDLKWLWKWLDVYEVYWKIEFWVMVPDTVANCSQAINDYVEINLEVTCYQLSPHSGHWEKKTSLVFWSWLRIGVYVFLSSCGVETHTHIYIWVLINTY